MLTEHVKIIITFCIIMIMGYVSILKELINIFKYLHFKLQEQLKGEPIDLEIKMTTVDWKIPVFKSYGVIARFTSDASQYKEGETYLLVLKKYEFENGDVCYNPMRGIIIPTDGSKPQMYGTTLIECHSDGFEKGDNLEEYIRKFLNNNAE